MGLGFLLGGGLLLLPASEGLWSALHRFPSRAYWNAGWELLFSLVCLFWYAASWRALGRYRILHSLFAVLAATNLLYHFPTLMAVLGELAANQAWSAVATIDRKAVLELMARGDVLSLSVHFGLASFAVTSVALLGMISCRGDSALDEESIARVARKSALVGFISTVLQFPVGVWMLLSLSRRTREALLGANLWASLLFVASLLLALLLLGRLLTIALGDLRGKDLRRVGWLMALIVCLMTATLRASRTSHALPLIQKSKKTVVETLSPRPMVNCILDLDSDQKLYSC